MKRTAKGGTRGSQESGTDDWAMTGARGGDSAKLANGNGRLSQKQKRKGEETREGKRDQR
jgi:hypothetical protein